MFSRANGETKRATRAAVFMRTAKGSSVDCEAFVLNRTVRATAVAATVVAAQLEPRRTRAIAIEASMTVAGFCYGTREGWGLCGRYDTGREEYSCIPAH